MGLIRYIESYWDFVCRFNWSDFDRYLRILFISKEMRTFKLYYKI